ncbi:MAG: fumarylacetoacetate hydrolase family protein [Gemmataceae bacterium]
MKLASIKTSNGERAAVFDGGTYIDIQTTDPSLPSRLRCILDQGEATLAKVAALKNNPKAVRINPTDVTLLSPITEPNKVICVGLNYKDHAAESGLPVPREPVLFSKFPTALTGHDQPIVLPPVSNKVDYEAELVLVIGTKGRNIKAADAMKHLAGYTIGHDVSARDWQLEKDGKQWMIGKTFDTFAPCGPYLVTRDEIADPHKLNIKLRLNSHTMQDSNTSQFIFTIPEIIAYISQVVTLLPGDLIFTGTPPGVGMARKPPVLLKAGDLCEVEIEGLGILRNPVVMG